MLDREGDSLDLQEVRVAQQAIDVDAYHMRGQLGILSGTQSPKGMRVIDLDVELLRQLVVDRLDDLTDGVDDPPEGPWQLSLLVAAWQRQQADAVVSPQLGCLFGADVGFVTDRGQVRMPA